MEPERVDMPAIHRGQHRLPCVEAYGPQPQTITTRWSRQHSQNWNLWQTEWRREGFPEDLSEAICDRVLTDISAATIAWSSEPNSDLTWIWCEIVEEYASDAERYPHALWAFALWGRTSMYDVIEQIEEIDHKLHIEEQYLELIYEFPIAGLLDRLERLHRDRPPEPAPAAEPAPVPDHRRHLPLEPISSAFDNSEQLLGTVTNPEVCSWPKQEGIPICELQDGRKALIILHLFSGRRRQGDCHDWAETLIEQYFPGFVVIMLSIDTAVGGAHCDLLQGPGLESLHRIVATGIIAGVLSGPPCETWSAARHIRPPPELRARWPRPLRSAERAWGVGFLTLRELQQLAVGSALMLANLRIEVAVVLRGGAAILEHPEIPEDDTFASVWRTPIQHRLCGAAPGHQRLHIQQWKYGAPAIKPTLLRIMGLPRSATILHAQALSGVSKPDRVLAGRDEVSGQFKTACAKEYPSGLCRALVVTLLSGLATRRQTEGVALRSWAQLEERDKHWLGCVAYHSATSFSSSFLPDYQPKG
jgi:hypothetical protein